MSEPFLGQITMVGFNFAPRGWAQCDGQLLPINQYQALFSILGTTYGGDGRTSFALPDLRGRLPMHPGTGPGLTPRSLGAKVGAEEVVLTAAEIPPHSVAVQATNEPGDTADPSGARPAMASGNAYSSATPDTPMYSETTPPNSGGVAHNNMQPYGVINYIIALQGIFPARN